MTPIIKVSLIPDAATMHDVIHGPRRIEIDGRAVGPTLTEKEAGIVAKWLDLAWEELP